MPGGDAAILRFTAPTTGLYAVSASFFAGDSGETDAWVIRDSNFAVPLASLGITSTNPAFDARGINLEAGNTLDFVVGNHGNFLFGTTPLSVQISAVPEPTTALLAMLGSMLIVGIARRRPA